MQSNNSKSSRLEVTCEKHEYFPSSEQTNKQVLREKIPELMFTAANIGTFEVESTLL